LIVVVFVIAYGKVFFGGVIAVPKVVQCTAEFPGFIRITLG
jgi:hypothetical protein